MNNITTNANINTEKILKSNIQEQIDLLTLQLNNIDTFEEINDNIENENYYDEDDLIGDEISNEYKNNLIDISNFNTDTEVLESINNTVIDNSTINKYDNTEDILNAYGVKSKYEVVFYVRYNYTESGRPLENDIIDKFNKYGVVDHIKCLKDTDYAFIFMKKLNTLALHRRTRTVIDMIKNDMTTKDCFYIDVARSTKFKTPVFNKFTNKNVHNSLWQPGLVHPALKNHYQNKNTKYIPSVKNKNINTIQQKSSQYSIKQKQSKPIQPKSILHKRGIVINENKQSRTLKNDLVDPIIKTRPKLQNK